MATPPQAQDTDVPAAAADADGPQPQEASPPSPNQPGTHDPALHPPLEAEVSAISLEDPVAEGSDADSGRNGAVDKGKLPLVAEDDIASGEGPENEANIETEEVSPAALPESPTRAPSHVDVVDREEVGESSSRPPPRPRIKSKKRFLGPDAWAGFFGGKVPAAQNPTVGQPVVAGPATPAESRSPPPVEPLPWEIDPERPAQKLPLRFKDAVGRSFLVPWRTASTWDSMKEMIDGRFSGAEDILRTAVALGRFDVTITPAPASDPQLYVQRPPQGPFHHRPRRTFDVTPDAWGDLVQPGAFAQMNMWPRQANHPVWHWPPGMAPGPPGGNMVPPPMRRPRIINVPAPPPPGSRSGKKKGKTYKNTGRPVRVKDY